MKSILVSGAQFNKTEYVECSLLPIHPFYAYPSRQEWWNDNDDSDNRDENDNNYDNDGNDSNAGKEANDDIDYNGDIGI